MEIIILIVCIGLIVYEVKNKSIIEWIEKIENKIYPINKEIIGKVSIGILILILILTFGSIKNQKYKIEKLENEKETKQVIINEREYYIDKQEKQIKELNNKLEVAKDYLELDENEKPIVDAKIDEVNKATEEAIQKEREEKEAAERAAKEAEEKKKQDEEQAKKEAQAQAEAQKYNTGITWEDMARDTYGRMGEYTTISGKIIQVMNGTLKTQYRLAVDGDYNKVLLIEIDNSKITQNILEDDYITVKGECYGNVTYTTVMGANKTIPSLKVDSYSY